MLKLHNPKNFLTLYYIKHQHLPRKERRWLSVLGGSTGKMLTFLSFHFSFSGGGGGGGAVAEVSVVEDQRHVVVGLIDIFLGGNSDAAMFQGGKESCGDAIDEPHGHPIRFSATSDLVFATIFAATCWSESEEAVGGGGGGGCHGYCWSGHNNKKMVKVLVANELLLGLVITV